MQKPSIVLVTEYKETEFTTRMNVHLLRLWLGEGSVYIRGPVHMSNFSVPKNFAPSARFFLYTINMYLPTFLSCYAPQAKFFSV